MAGRSKKRFRNWLIWGFTRFLLALAKLLPLWVLTGFGSVLGKLGYYLSSRDRKRSLNNLRLAYPEMSDQFIKKTAKKTFSHFGKLLTETLKIPTYSKESINRIVEIENIDLIKNAISEGRGVVIATGHIGNWELMGAAAALNGIPMNVIARLVKIERLNDLIIDMRSKVGIKTIIREAPDSARKILRSLRSSEMLALLIDQDTSVEGVFVDFFGRKAHTPTGAAVLAQKTGALFVAAATRRVRTGKHVVMVEEIKINNDLSRDHAIIDATQRVTSRFESWIRESPEQWPWFHNRWKTRPENES